jgi:hypothetical protein
LRIKLLVVIILVCQPARFFHILLYILSPYP